MGNYCGKTQSHKEEVEMNKPTAEMQKVYAVLMKRIADVLNSRNVSSEVERTLDVPGYSGSLAEIIEYESKSCDRTALMKICDGEHREVKGLEALINALIKNGWNVNKQNSRGETALFLATRSNNLSAIEALLNNGADPNKSDRDKLYNAFHLTALRGYDRATKLLLYYGLEKKDIDAQSVDGNTPLILAIRHKKFNVAEMLIDKGRANVKLCDNNGITALHEAARSNASSIAKLLLDDGADVSSKDKNGKTALDLAKEKGHSEIVTVISDALPDNPKKEVQIEIKEQEIEKEKKEIKIDKKPTVEEFVSAIEQGDLNKVRKLVREGADINAKDAFGRKPIHVVTEYGHKNVIEFLLSNGVGVNDTDKNGSTPLHYAAFKGLLDVAKFLIDKGANIHAKTNYGQKPIHIAAWKGQLEVVKFLVDKGANINAQDNTDIDKKPIHFAAIAGHKNVIEFLLSQGVSVNDISTGNGWTPLHYAAWCDQLEVAKFLIDKGANIHAKTTDGEKPIDLAKEKGHSEIVSIISSASKNNPREETQTSKYRDVQAGEKPTVEEFFSAIEQGDLNKVRKLVKEGADVNTQNNKTEKPIHVAAQYGHKNVIEFFLSKGVSVNYADKDGWTPLHHAAWCDQLEVAKFLLDKGASIHAQGTTNGEKPIHIAAGEGHKNVIGFFLSKGVSIDDTDKNNWTPLHYAVLKGHLDVAKFLIDEGANIHVKDNNGKTSLCLAKYRGYAEIVSMMSSASKDNPREETQTSNYQDVQAGEKPTVEEFSDAIEQGDLNKVRKLVREGADLNTADNGWKAPLHLAAWKGQLEVAKFLANEGANINAKDAFGKKPIHLAAMEGHKNVVEFLLSKGANVNDTDRNGWTPLHCASYKGHMGVIEFLLMEGADIDAQAVDHRKLIHVAAQGGHKNVIEFLLSKGASVNGADKHYWTPLHYAVWEGHLEAAKFLIDKGANIHLKNVLRGGKLIDVSKRRGHSFIAELLSYHEQSGSVIQSASNPASYLNNVLENNQFAYQSTHGM